jgi:hypothetical protein
LPIFSSVSLNSRCRYKTNMSKEFGFISFVELSRPVEHQYIWEIQRAITFKGKVLSVYTMRVKVYLYSFLNLALDGGQWLTSHSGSFTLGK